MLERMQAVVFHGEGRWGVESAPLPQIADDDDVLLRVECAGICGTDIHILSTPPSHPATAGSILGHEYAAEVVETGAGIGHLKPGDRQFNQYLATRYEVTIHGSFIQRTEFPKVVRLLESGILPLEKLITHRLSLDRIGEGFDAMRAGEAIKVVAACR
jgi:threonine dehydrogenase-like Zn-dependent dehydrogenase